MADIADKLNIHESTVSRAVHQKFLQCTWGTFPLNYFFVKNALRSSSSPIFKTAGEQGGTTTAFDIKAALKKIIDGENKKSPTATVYWLRNWKSRDFPSPGVQWRNTGKKNRFRALPAVRNIEAVPANPCCYWPGQFSPSIP